MYMNRRDFLRTAGGAAGGTAAVSASTGTAAAAESGGGGGGGGGGGKPDLGGYLDGVGNYNGNVQDMTGQDEVTVEVGVDNGGQPYGFGPAAVHISKGTTVKFEWTGEGGGHNVVAENEAFDSGSAVASAGVNFEHAFEEGGVFNYFCSPHKSLGMKGSIVVGQPGADFETVAAGGNKKTPLNPEHMGVPFQAHYVGIATVLMMVVSLIFTFFLLKYGESSHSKGGND
jgi:halocyanin-like protein